jgi:23S rRNA pseudouridine2605 synthase
MGEGEEIRLQKFLSRAGVASRREAERMISAGRVRVNGEVVTELGVKVDPASDRVEVNGREVGLARPRWIAFHKPRGVLTTRSDTRGRRTVYDVLPEDARGLRYVGRLDRSTEGLLLLTNQGDLANRLLHPSGEVEREYRAWVVGTPSADAVRRIQQGVELEDGRARAKRVRVVTERDGRSLVELVLVEGRKREVRRLLEAVGHPVRRLQRVRFGSLRLGRLRAGEWRELSKDEVRALERGVKRR